MTTPARTIPLSALLAATLVAGALAPLGLHAQGDGAGENAETEQTAPVPVPNPTPREQWPDPQELLSGLDRNLVFETRTANMTMTVQNRRRVRTFEIRSYGRGEEDSAMEYLSPAREAGTKMLKLGDELWMYLPSVDRTQRISGHMLRQGMMGSDLSYEDMMASRELQDAYEAEVVGEEMYDGRACWRVQMVATDDTVSYPRRVTWVDKETLIPLKQELYALSDMLLKTWTMSEIQEFEGGRLFPTRMEVRDHLRENSSTIIEFSELVFGVDLEQEVFSQRWLERN